MKKKLKKTGFSESTFITWLAIVVTKFLGVVYNIPFYSIIGDDGGFLYGIVYQVYGLFLELSTSGIPTAISMTVSHYNAIGKYATKEKAYRLASRFIIALSAIMFCIMFFGAGPIGRFYLGDMNGAISASELTFAIRIIALCILVVPFLSVRRGYLQGHGFFEVSSISQIIEQVVRITLALSGAWIAIKVMHSYTSAGVYIALFATSLGALFAALYIEIKIRRNRLSFEKGEEGEKEDAVEVIVRRIAGYCLTITLVSIVCNIYNIIDTKLMMVGLKNVGYQDTVNQQISSLTSSWVPKIAEVIGALATAMTASIAPSIASSYARNDLNEVNEKINKGVSTLFLLTLPMTIGMIVFAEPCFRVFYGYNSYGPSLLQVNTAFRFLSYFTMVLSMALQSLGGGRQVIFLTILCIGINAVGDLPFIYLLHDLGLPAYFGPMVSSTVSEIIKLAMIIYFIKKLVKVSFRPSLQLLKKELLPVSAMTAVIIILQKIWPPVDGRILLVPQLVIYALAGVVVFAVPGFRNHMIQDVLGEDFIDSILYKLHLKKRPVE